MVLSTYDEVAKVGFELIGWKMRDSKMCTFSDEEVELAIREYKRFLELKIANPGINLAPTDLMDEAWHFHILDTKRYAVDCQRMFNQFLHHVPSYGPYESPNRENALLKSYERMMALYREQYGQDPFRRMGSCSSACSGVDDFGPDPSCGDD